MGLQVVTNFHPPMRARCTAAQIDPIWYRSYDREAEAAEHLKKMFLKAKPGTVADRALNLGWLAVERTLDQTVAAIVRRGGLLLIGGGL